MPMLGAFLGGNPPEVPAGKSGISLCVNTTDRQNLSTASWTIVSGSRSYSASADESGRAYIEVDSGYTYTVTLSHQGNYENDGPQTVIAESTMQYGVLFDLFDYPAASTLVVVQTYPGLTVTATGGGSTLNATADSSGAANFEGLPANSTWTFSIAEGDSKSVTIKTLVTNVTLNYTVVTVKAKSGTEVTATNGITTLTATAGSSDTATFNALVLGQSWTFSISSPTSLSSTITVAMQNEVDLLIRIWGVRIAVSTTDPEDRCVYTDDAVGLTPASGHNMNGWVGTDILEDIKPVRLASGVKTYLDLKNLSKTIDGAASNIGTAGNDAMTEFPLRYLSLRTDGTYIYIRFSSKKVDGNFYAYAHTQSGALQSAFYVGCFLGYVASDKLYSRSGSSPTVSTSITNFITYAKARGTGYDIFHWFQLIYIQCLFVLFYKSTDSQTALGTGYVGGSSAQTTALISYDNNYGLAGTTSATVRMSFLWLTDLWGNVNQFIGRAKTNSSYELMTVMSGYSSVTESDFTDQNTTPTSSRSGYISAVSGGPTTGFFPTACSGSSTTLWCDYGYVYSSYFPAFGGYYDYGDLAGLFRVNFSGSATGASSYVGSRLSYCLGVA